MAAGKLERVLRMYVNHYNTQGRIARSACDHPHPSIGYTSPARTCLTRSTDATDSAD